MASTPPILDPSCAKFFVWRWVLMVSLLWIPMSSAHFYCFPAVGKQSGKSSREFGESILTSTRNKRIHLLLRRELTKEYLITCERRRNINHPKYIESAEAAHNFSWQRTVKSQGCRSNDRIIYCARYFIDFGRQKFHTITLKFSIRADIIFRIIRYFGEVQFCMSSSG